MAQLEVFYFVKRLTRTESAQVELGFHLPNWKRLCEYNLCFRCNDRRAYNNYLDQRTPTRLDLLRFQGYTKNEEFDVRNVNKPLNYSLDSYCWPCDYNSSDLIRTCVMSIPFVYLSCTTPNDINVPDFLFKAPLFRISMDCWLLVLDGAVENPNQIVVKRLFLFHCQWQCVFVTD